ncbi:MAG TPA: MarR family transcriptional regulator [Actinomycetes bacterium]|jgi:DNA-binding transcriptional MocR family regulator|nr:MarR family transcriptional regulator [Actinomycetes bacterium]
MATTGTTGAKTPSVEAILDALRHHPDATAAELAEAAGIGRSTAGKTLANLEAQGRVSRQRDTSGGGKATPDHWTLVSDPPADHTGRAEPEPQPATGEVPVDEPAATPETSAEAPSAEAVPPATGTPDTGEADATAATTQSAPDADRPPGGATGSGPRLRPGALRALVHAWLAERPGQEFTPTRIGKELGRSAGAVGNALATMTDQGEVTQTSSKPRMYALAEGGDQASATR